VANYFEKHSPPYPYYSALSPDSSEVPDIAAIVGGSDGIYNRIGRGIPDVSANGDNDAVSPETRNTHVQIVADHWT
jgi:tripeptidyl-peptidase-1